MYKNGRGPRWPGHLCRTDALAGPLWMHLRRLTVSLALALLSSYIFTMQTHARISTWIGDRTEAYSSEQQNLYDRNLLSSSETNSSKTGARVDNSACKKAEQLYDAASADARTLERAIFISAFRREVERALGRRLTDDELRTLANQARAEAHRWYRYIQADQRCAASWHGELRPHSSTATHCGRDRHSLPIGRRAAIAELGVTWGNLYRCTVVVLRSRALDPP